jgi:hypothetical protein
VPPPGINDPNYSGLVLSAGLHTVSGAESLAFVRDRHGLADGTDLNRIRMQQMFVSSLFNKLASAGTLGDPITLYKIADAVTGNISVDTELDNISTMISIAESVGTVDKKYMRYITAPYEPDPDDSNRLIPGPDFTEVWNYLRADAPPPGSPAAAAFGTLPNQLTSYVRGAAASASPSPTPSSSIATESRNGDENICANLPAVATYGGSPDD